MFVAALNGNYKQSGNIAIGILMGPFLISSLVIMVERLEFLKYLTPFKYFETSYLLNELILEPIYLVVSLVIILIRMAIPFIFYTKRDLKLS